MLTSVGIRPGWKVLDAGCGSGSFLPLMADLVGPEGQVAAFDLDPENIDRVRTLVNEWDVPVSPRVGNIAQLPYPDASFDAVWSANVVQYLTEIELTQVLMEFVRVVKPGGLVAIKEFDYTVLNFSPFDTFVWWRYIDQLAKKNPGIMCALSLSRQLKAAGLLEVTQQAYPEEKHAPLSQHDKVLIAGAFKFMADELEVSDMDKHDYDSMQVFNDPNSSDNPINRPDYYFRECHILAIGKKPE